MNSGTQRIWARRFDTGRAQLINESASAWGLDCCWVRMRGHAISGRRMRKEGFTDRFGNPRRNRSAGFQTCRAADFQSARSRHSHDGRIWKSAPQQTRRSALHRSAGFQTCCAADFQSARSRHCHDGRIWKSALQQTRRSALHRSAGFQTCRAADFQSARSRHSHDGRIWKSAPQQTRRSALQRIRKSALLMQIPFPVASFSLLSKHAFRFAAARDALLF